VDAIGDEKEMKDYKGILSAVIVLVFAVGLMGILGLIVVDEFMMANENGGELDSNIIELLQMSITGIIGLVAGYVGGKN
jgi:predicted PurR-regulated permease PerM